MALILHLKIGCDQTRFFEPVGEVWPIELQLLIHDVEFPCPVDDGPIVGGMAGIKDSGPGIPEKLLLRIFDPLFTTRQVGTGLGLPVCKTIVEQHNGSISAETEFGTSTTFCISLKKHLILEQSGL